MNRHMLYSVRKKYSTQNIVNCTYGKCIDVFDVLNVLDLLALLDLSDLFDPIVH